MIDAKYCAMMSRYNYWQNSQLFDALQALPDVELSRDRGAFFGSIIGTANHLLWGDKMWMARFDGGPCPDLSISESAEICLTFAEWSAERSRTDGRIRIWADNVKSVDLHGDLTWMSGATGAEMTRPLAVCVAHMFNHQTHHRGQIHAMITAAGGKAPVSDLAFMPD